MITLMKKFDTALFAHLHSFLKYYIPIVFHKQDLISKLALLYDLYQNTISAHEVNKRNGPKPRNSMRFGFWTPDFGGNMSDEVRSLSPSPSSPSSPSRSSSSPSPSCSSPSPFSSPTPSPFSFSFPGDEGSNILRTGVEMIGGEKEFSEYYAEIGDAILLPFQSLQVHLEKLLSLAEMGLSLSGVTTQEYLHHLLCVFGREKMFGVCIRKEESCSEVNFTFFFFHTFVVFKSNNIFFKIMIGLFFTSYLSNKGSIWRQSSSVTPTWISYSH